MDGYKFALFFKIIQLSLSDRGGALRTPDSWSFLAVDQTFLVEFQEGKLSDSTRIFVDCAVGVAPVDGKSQTLPEFLVLIFSRYAELQAFFNEGRPPDISSTHP